MRRLLTISALFAPALALTATAQPPAQPKSGPAWLDKKADKKAEKKPDPTDAAIAAALAHDADVKMAQAKMQLAEAELAKARGAVTIKVVTLKARIEQLKAQLGPVEQQLAFVTERYKAGATQYAEVLTIREKVEVTKSSLALAETEWKLLTGAAGAGVSSGPGDDKSVASVLQWLSMRQNGGNAEADAARLLLAAAAQERAAVKGPVAERVRAALDKPVKLGEKGQFVNFQAALEAFQKAGIDIPFRQKVELDTITSEGETLPVGAWLQLFLDSSPGMVMVVREYGVLVVKKEDAPPDATGVVDFWKQKSPAKEPKAESKTAPKK
jgi:hypothetical protein